MCDFGQRVNAFELEYEHPSLERLEYIQSQDGVDEILASFDVEDWKTDGDFKSWDLIEEMFDGIYPTELDAEYAAASLIDELKNVVSSTFYPLYCRIESF